MALREEINRAKWSLELARIEEGHRIAEALQLSRVVGVLGEAEVGKTETIRQALGPSDAEYPTIRLDLDGAAGEGYLAFRLLREIADAWLGTKFSTLKVGVLIPKSLEKERLELAELLGVDGLEEALRDWASGHFDLSRALRALERLAQKRRTTLWIDHLEAPSLTPRHPLEVDKLLWAVREMTQTTSRLSVVLSGRNAFEKRVLGPEAAFHQQGRWISLDTPGPEVWRAVASDLKVSSEVASDLVALTGGHPETMLSALLQAARNERHINADELLLELASTSAAVAGRTVQHACSLHRLGGQVLLQVAMGQGPYAASQRGESPHQEITKVLSRLQLAGLVRHDDGWTVVNPLVGIILRGEIPRASAPDWDWEIENFED